MTARQAVWSAGWWAAVGLGLWVVGAWPVAGAFGGEAPQATPPSGEAASAQPSPEEQKSIEEWLRHMRAAESAFRLRNFAKAEAELLAAIKVAETLGPTNPRLALALARLMRTYSVQGKHLEAIGPGKRLLEINEKVRGPKDLQVAMALNDLAGQYQDLKKFDEAKPLYERALKICEEADPAKAAPLLALVLDNLARLHRDTGDLDEAEHLARRALAMRKRVFGETHRWFAQSAETLGTVLLAKGKAAEAEDLFRQNLVICRMKVGWNRPILVRALRYLADACKAQKKYQEAENYYKQALRYGEGGLGRYNAILADAYEAYADLLRKTGREDEAKKMEAEAKALRPPEK